MRLRATNFSFLTVCGALVLWFAGVGATSRASAEPPPAPPPLAAAKSWGYQLQKLDPEVISAAPYDVIVIDYSKDGTDGEALSAADVARLKSKPDGGRRIVLAYFSVGEAEMYRYYWQWYWYFPDLAPPWLGSQNKKWQGNFPVRFWQPDWQAILFAGESSYLDRIIAAGFDGIYLDRVDVYHDFEDENPDAQTQMIAMVKAIAARARSLKPGFLIVPQNGEELLTEADYRATIDGIAKEDLLYGDGRAKRPNSNRRIEHGLNLLKLLSADGKPVFAVEYLDAPDDIARARKQIEGYGFIPHFADRKLETMRIGDLPATPPRTRGSAKR